MSRPPQLVVSEVTDTSVFLSWAERGGFWRLQIRDVDGWTDLDHEGTVKRVDGLEPGVAYKFRLRPTKTLWTDTVEPVTVTTYSRPVGIREMATLIEGHPDPKTYVMPCPAALNYKGEHIGCDLEHGHLSSVHGNTEHGAIWRGAS